MPHLPSFLRLKLSHRILISFGAVLLILLALTALALQRIGNLGDTLLRVAGTGAQRSQAIRGMERNAVQVNQLLLGMQSAAADQLVVQVQKIDTATRLYRESSNKALALTTEADGRGMIQRANAAAANSLEILDLARKENRGSGDAAIAMMTRLSFSGDNARWVQRLEDWRAAVEKLGAWDDAVVTGEAESSREMAESARWMLVIGAMCALTLSALTGWRLTRDVSKGLASAVNAAQQMASHDLSVVIPTERRDEIGAVLSAQESMRQNLHALAAGVIDATHSIFEASAEIGSGSLELSHRTEQAAATLERNNRTVNALSDSVHQASSVANEANAVASHACQMAREGERLVKQAMDTMQAIERSSRKIGDIIGIIDSIAFQTNILALNAAVEAARAGEQGRGFAVVASEVRNLAQRSAQAAKEIKDLISESLLEVSAGSKDVRETGHATLSIRESVEKVTKLIAEIASDSVAQLDLIQQVSNDASELEGSAQSNASMAEQAAAATHSLNDQAARLAHLVERFKLEKPSVDVPVASIDMQLGRHIRYLES